MSFSDKRQASKPPKSVFAYRGLETKHRNPSLHIHTKTNPHKVSNITQRYLQKCSYRRAGVECTVREHPVFCCLSLCSPVCYWSVCLLERWGERWVGLCRGLCSAGYGHRSLSWLDIVKWGQPQGQQECSRLISPKGAGDTRKKSKRLCRKTQMGPLGHFSCAALLQLADLKLWCKYQMTPTVMGRWFKTHFPLFITLLPFHWYFDRFKYNTISTASLPVQ